MADETKIITRIYEKISNSFAMIGGLTHALILLSKTILYFWSENNILVYLISTILPDEEKIKFFNKSNNNNELGNIERPKSFLFNKAGRRRKSNNNNDNQNQNRDLSVIENKNNFSNDNFIRIDNIQNAYNSFQPNDIIRENIIPNANNLVKEMKSKSLEENKSRPNFQKNLYLFKLLKFIYLNNLIFLRQFKNIPEAENKKDNAKKFEKEDLNKSQSFMVKNIAEFNFFNKFCITAFLPKKKKTFLSFAEKIIDRKLSMENILEITIKLEILRHLLLDEEESKQLDKLPLFKLKDHLEENYKI